MTGECGAMQLKRCPPKVRFPPFPKPGKDGAHPSVVDQEKSKSSDKSVPSTALRAVVDQEKSKASERNVPSTALRAGSFGSAQGKGPCDCAQGRPTHTVIAQAGRYSH